MADLSKYPCPLCGNTVENKVLHIGHITQIHCGDCSLGIEGTDGSEQSAADAWIELSEKVHGKQHDEPTVEVRIAVGVGPSRGANCSMDMQRLKEDMPKGSAFSWVTAHVPASVATEVQGSVEA